jgi:general secretion pathway protein C
VLAYWTWYWIAPKATARAPLAMEPAARVRVAHIFFGPSRTVAETTSSTGIKLLGVVAASGGQRGYAMLKVEDRETMTVREGDEIAGGMRLEAVGTDHVVLDRNGTRQTVRWPGKK